MAQYLYGYINLVKWNCFKFRLLIFSNMYDITFNHLCDSFKLWHEEFSCYVKYVFTSLFFLQTKNKC